MEPSSELLPSPLHGPGGCRGDTGRTGGGAPRRRAPSPLKSHVGWPTKSTTRLKRPRGTGSLRTKNLKSSFANKLATFKRKMDRLVAREPIEQPRNIWVASAPMESQGGQQRVSTLSGELEDEDDDCQTQTIIESDTSANLDRGSSGDFNFDGAAASTTERCTNRVGSSGWARDCTGRGAPTNGQVHRDSDEEDQQKQQLGVRLAQIDAQEKTTANESQRANNETTLLEDEGPLRAPPSPLAEPQAQLASQSRSRGEPDQAGCCVCDSRKSLAGERPASECLRGHSLDASSAKSSSHQGTASASSLARGLSGSESGADLTKVAGQHHQRDWRQKQQCAWVAESEEEEEGRSEHEMHRDSNRDTGEAVATKTTSCFRVHGGATPLKKSLDVRASSAQGVETTETIGDCQDPAEHSDGQGELEHEVRQQTASESKKRQNLLLIESRYDQADCNTTSKMLDQQPQASAQVLAPSMSVLSYHEHEQQLHCDAAATNMMNLNDLDEANLLEMLQALTKRRDELRLMDKQLFHLMAGCFVRLKSAGGNRGAKAQLVVSSSGSVSSPSSCSSSSFSSSSAGSTGELGAISTPLLDDGAIDLSRLNVGSGLSSSMESNDHQQGQQQKPKLEDNDQASKGHKRPKFTSPMNQHIKKQRLLSAIISTDDIGEKQQVLAEKELDVRNVDIEQPLTRAYGQRQSIQAIKEDQQASNHHQNKQLTEVVPRMNPSYQQPNSSLHLSSIQQQNLHQFHQFQFQLKLQDEFQQQQQQHQSDYSSLAKSLVAQPLAVYEQHHHQHFFDVAAALQQQFDTGNNSSASDQDEEGAQEANVHGSSRPQLKKFCSIGTAEMSFERFSRQQHLIDSTLATLAHQHQQASQQQQHLLVPIGNSMKPNSMSELMVQNQQQTSNCFSLSLPSSSSSSSSYTSCSSSSGSPVNTNKFVFSPFMMTVPSHQPQAPGSHRAQFYNELLCHQKTLTSASHQVEVPSGIAAGIYSTIQPVEPIPQQQPATQKCGSTFDRMLANAKELAPIVKKMPFRCHVCSSCFEDRHRLQQHLSIHLNLHPSWFEEKTIKETMAQYELRRGDYLCQVCQLRYETTSEFDKHMHSHGEKPHQCELCSQDNKFVSFRYFRQLLTHLRSHCFLYSCRFVPECRQTANRKDYLKLHILKHHLNNKLPEQYTICCH